MLTKKLLFLAGVAVACCVFSRPAQAQVLPLQCDAMRCNTCFPWMHEGEGYTTNPAAQHYEHTIGWCLFGGCSTCGAIRVNDGTAADAVAERLRTGSSQDLLSIVKRDRERFLVSTARNVVVMKGTKCSPSAFAVVVFVSKQRAAELSRLGVRSLEGYSQHPDKTVALR